MKRSRCFCSGPRLRLRCSGEKDLLHVALVGLDHFLDHLAADGAGFAGGQVAVVAVGQVHANLPWCLFYIVNVKLPRIVLKSPCFEGNFQGIQDAGTQ